MTLPDVKELFGSFRSSDRRPQLFAVLERLLLEARETGFVLFAIINGSFVTGEDEPGDVDVILAVDPRILGKAEFAPHEYNVLSRRRVRSRHHGVDLLVAPAGGQVYQEYLELFSRVKGLPGMTKGIVRLELADS